MFDSKFPAIDGLFYSIQDVLNEHIGVVIIFTSIQCPYALQYYANIESLKNTYPDIGFILVNSNATIDDDIESLDEMKNDFPDLSVIYIKDEEKILEKYLGANTTPECFLLDRKSEIQYRGAIDDKFTHPDEYEELRNDTY